MSLVQQLAWRFQHRQVTELAWSLSSPDLFPSRYRTHASILNEIDQTQLLNWLDELDRRPQPLLDHLSRLRSPRLGIYFEGLIAFFWQHFPGCRLLQQNLQLNEVDSNGRKHTVGELDFVVQYQRTYWHIEAAVKFYLGVRTSNPDTKPGDASEWSQWVGPNANDRLDLKLNRLLEHQLPVAGSNAATAPLQALGIDQRGLNSALQLQGYLFYPTRYSLPPPRDSHPDHLRGRWFYLSDFLDQTATARCLWYPLPKAQWLIPARTCRQSLLNRQQLAAYFKTQFSQSGRPILLAEMAETPSPAEAADERWQETKRDFIVPDYWPSTATPSRKT